MKLVMVSPPTPYKIKPGQEHQLGLYKKLINFLWVMNFTPQWLIRSLGPIGPCYTR